jgi:nucleolar complex protein 2
MGKATKATRKFVASGQLKRTIEARRKSQAIRKKVQGRKGARGGQPQVKTKNADTEWSDGDGDNEEPELPSKKKKFVLHISVAFLTEHVCIA